MDYMSLRNFKDFLQQYNKITENCFLHCVNTLGERSVTSEEQKCVDLCTLKHIKVNHKVMSVYLEVQPIIMNRRIEELNQAQAAMVSADTNTNIAPVQQQPVETTQPITAQS
ncbi:translocase of inner membrane 9b [Lycorma delicatula]|uniref:translocase of inner membrane 9b n=1 Tax=Lycorma delicatula TaxID=130591 RepID=UPI003F5134CB